MADTVVHAIRGISIEFRSNEFVSILGASGCGKTTLLNIIGGLDQYTKGDLLVKGKSTKNFKDADWDVYRNHRIGFIFQSYNLIPHQTVLGNVEMALTIAGVSAEERKRRAIEALERVGLKEQINKKPNQLSGGQMQRVAIARALVNNPEILLADEPTGALDSQTSVQIMDLIKEISGERLVIMVTHNPELAEQYSSRIVKLHDGQIVSDSNPFEGEKEPEEEVTKKKKGKKEKKEKASMSLFTAIKLSFRNLMSKRGRTFITSIAGSIGIIGVSLVLALSAGIQNYIDGMQDDMLSGNPITISETGYNLNALTDAMNSMEKVELVKEKGRVYIDSYVESLAKIGAASANMLVKNEITKDYVDYVSSMPKDYYSALKVDYGIDISHNLYTDYVTTDVGGGEKVENMSVAATQSRYTALLNETDYKEFTSFISSFTDIFSQAPKEASEDGTYLSSQYDILAGKIATEKDELMLVISDDEATDMLLAQLGFLSQDSFLARAYKATGNEYNEEDIFESIPYEQLLNKSFTWYPNDEIFSPNETPSMMGEYGMCSYIYEPYGTNLKNGLPMKIVGILQAKESISYGCLTRGMYYTQDFAEYVLEQNLSSAVVESIKNNENSPTALYSGYYTYAMGENTVSVPTGIAYRYSYVYEGEEKSKMEFVGVKSRAGSMMSMFSSFMGGGNSSQGNEMVSITLHQLGGDEVADNLAVYPIDFEKKDLVTDYLDAWGKEGNLTYQSLSLGEDVTLTEEDRGKIAYTDSLQLVISMIKTMINIITYALVAFTGISLVVSSVMIGVITYVSVVERTKEIGTLRALGARKKDVKNLFYAETFIIGLFAGGIGVGFTYLLCIPINLLLGSLTGIASLALLPWNEAVAMVLISVILTSISGLIPASAAAKKDPVVALRTE